jgi:hypothetical protein
MGIHMGRMISVPSSVQPLVAGRFRWSIQHTLVCKSLLLKKQIRVKNTREGIGCSRQAGGGRTVGEEVEKQRRERLGCRGEPQQLHDMKAEQDDVRNVEWELCHCRQARQQQHGQKAEGEVTCRRGMGTSSSLIWSGAPHTLNKNA